MSSTEMSSKQITISDKVSERKEAKATGTEQTGAEQTGAEQTGAEQTGTEQTGAEQTGAEQTGAGPTKKERQIERVREQLVPERIVEVEGRPVRLTLRLSGSVVATMVEPGYFPISTTGFRSLIPFPLRSHSNLSEEDPTVEEIFRDARAALEGLPEKREEDVEQAVRRCDREIEKIRGGISAIVRHTSPSGQKLANLALTSDRTRREEILEAGIRQYRRVNRLPQPDWTEIENHRHWTIQGYMHKRQRAASTLRALMEARQRGLFAGTANYEPLLRKAAPTVRWVWTRSGRAEVSEKKGTSKGQLRAVIRYQRDSDALREEDLDALATAFVEQTGIKV